VSVRAIRGNLLTCPRRSLSNLYRQLLCDRNRNVLSKQRLEIKRRDEAHLSVERYLLAGRSGGPQPWSSWFAVPLIHKCLWWLN
jgi:hypothetical protein